MPSRRRLSLHDLGSGRECLIAELPGLSRLERPAGKKSSSAAGVLLAIFTEAALVAPGFRHFAYSLVAHLAQQGEPRGPSISYLLLCALATRLIRTATAH